MTKSRRNKQYYFHMKRVDTLKKQKSFKKGRHNSSKIGMSFVLWTVLFACITGGLYYGGTMIFRGNYFTIQHVVIRDSGTITKEYVERVSGVKLKGSLFTLDIQKIKSALEKNCTIATVEVARVFPDKVVITVNERRPVARIEKGSYTYLVDKDGAVLGRKKTDSLNMSYLPLVTGVYVSPEVIGKTLYSKPLCQTLSLLDDVSVVSESIGFRIVRVHLQKNGTVELSDSTGKKILFDARNMSIDDLMTKIKIVVADLKDKKIEFSSIDMRFKDVVVKPVK